MNDRVEDVIFYALDRTYRKKQSMAQKRFAAHGMTITPEQWVLLKIVTQYEGITQVELAQKAIKDTASITRILDILEKKQLLSRQQDPNDRRKYVIVATKEGYSYIADNLEFIKTIRKDAVKGITKQELETLRSLLEKMQQNME